MPDRRALQLPVAFLPWVVGGREVHTDRLCRGLRAIGWDPMVVIHQDLSKRESLGRHVVSGTEILVLPTIEGQTERAPIYSRIPRSNPGFDGILHEFDPHVVHLHDFSIGANIGHIRSARRAGKPVVMTFHSPGQTCLQTELRYRGREFSEGEILAHRCTECRLVVAGVPGPLAHVFASKPVAWAAARLPVRQASKVGRALTARRMTEMFADSFGEMVASAARLIVHAEWQRHIMLINGVPEEKVAIIPNGIDYPEVTRHRDPGDGPLRLAFVGRCDPPKGPEVLIDAIRSLPPDLPVEVHLFGLYWDGPFGRHLLGKITGDHRFVRPVPLAPSEVVAKLATMDLCVIPPLWVEVDPQILLESFAAGTPVIGSDGYGISERVRPGVDGLLFPPGDVGALAAIVQALCLDRAKVRELGAGVRAPRSSLDMASDVVAIYEEVSG